MEEASQVATWLSTQSGVVEAWAAFNTVGVEATIACDVSSLIEAFSPAKIQPVKPKEHVVPVLYDLEGDYDLAQCAVQLGVTADEVVRLHNGVTYMVEAVGFSPGFGYLSGLPTELCGLPRLPTPRKRVPVGAVGVTEWFCGVYPSASPGGWNLIGRTPLVIVDIAASYFPLRCGDCVRFSRIDADQFKALEGKRLGD